MTEHLFKIVFWFIGSTSTSERITEFSSVHSVPEHCVYHKMIYTLEFCWNQTPWSHCVQSVTEHPNLLLLLSQPVMPQSGRAALLCVLQCERPFLIHSVYFRITLSPPFEEIKPHGRGDKAPELCLLSGHQRKIKGLIGKWGLNVGGGIVFSIFSPPATAAGSRKFQIFPH